MIEYAKAAEALEPDGMIAIPPTTANSLAEIRDYYAALCEVTARPIFVQTSGGPDIELTIDFLVQLAEEFPQCGYIKEEYGRVHDRMLALQQYQPDPIRSIFGATLGRGWLYEMRIGTDGVMTGGACTPTYMGTVGLYDRRPGKTMRDCYTPLLCPESRSDHSRVRTLCLQKRAAVFKTTVSRRGAYTSVRWNCRDRLPLRGAEALSAGVIDPDLATGLRRRRSRQWRVAPPYVRRAAGWSCRNCPRGNRIRRAGRQPWSWAPSRLYGR